MRVNYGYTVKATGERRSTALTALVDADGEVE